MIVAAPKQRQQTLSGPRFVLRRFLAAIPEERLHVSAPFRDIPHARIPDDLVIHVVVEMRDDMTQGDPLVHTRYVRRDVRIHAPYVVQRFADDLQLTLNP
jgi:hypothetical protein